MNNIIIQIADVEMTFAVIEYLDSDHGAPWDNEDCHGPVTGWTRREKRPDELVLNEQRGNKRYYNFKEACAIALRDGWGCDGLGGTETKRQKAAIAARADFENLCAWCNDEWAYMGVEVVLLDSEGNRTEVTESIWGVDSRYLEEEAQRMADELAHGLHTRFEQVTQTITSYKMI